jgi:DNA-directed RNA polymerase specialized sigma24 family protein
MSGKAVRRQRRARDNAPDGTGSGRSYEELYVEYAPAARGLALSMVPPDVADDIVAEAFARVLAAIRGRRAGSRVPRLPARGRT